MNITFREIIGRWPSITLLARLMSEGEHKVNKWYSRNSIPSEYWGELLRVAKISEVKLSAMDLVQAAEAAKKEKAA